jgi:hypothetical protein
MSGDPVNDRGGRLDVPVEAGPIANSSTSHRTHVLIRPREDLLVLLPSPALAVAGRGILLVSFFPAAIAVLGLLTSGGWAPLIVLGVTTLTALLGLLFLYGPRRHVFDLRRGLWATHGPFLRSQQPLRQVLAVQMNPGRSQGGAGPADGSLRYRTFELNLVLASEPRRRTNLTCHADGRATWQAGRYLAHALQMPFLDQVPRRPAPPTLPAGAPSRASPVARKSPRSIGWVFAGLGIVGLVVGLGLLAWSLVFYLGAERVEGTVQALAPGNKGTRAPVVGYEVAGRAYTYRSSYYSSPPAYRVGDKVTLLYLPDDPASCRIDSFFEEWGAALLCTVVGAVFGVVGFALLNWRPFPTTPPLAPEKGSAE